MEDPYFLYGAHGCKQKVSERRTLGNVEADSVGQFLHTSDTGQDTEE